MVANIKRMPIGRSQRRCQRHQTKVASHTAVPIGTANQRSLFAKRGKVNGWTKRHHTQNLAAR